MGPAFDEMEYGGQVHELCTLCETEFYEHKNVLFHAGTLSEKIYFLITGHVRILRVAVRTLRPGDVRSAGGMKSGVQKRS